MDNMIFTSEVCGVVLIAPFDKISRPPCSTIRFIVFLSLFFRCFYPFFLYHRIFLLTVESKQYVYMLRCTPTKGDYNFYMYCYQRVAFEKYRAQLKNKARSHAKKRAEPER